MATTTVEVWVLIDDEGNHVASHDAGLLNDLFEEHIQELSDAGGLRRVKLTITVPLPEVIEIEAEVPETEEQPVVTVR